MIAAFRGSKLAYESKDLWISLGELNQCINEYLTEWDKSDLDIVLCPTFPFPAPKLEVPGMNVPPLSYVVAHNAMNFPSGTIPITSENKHDQVNIIKH